MQRDSHDPASGERRRRSVRLRGHDYASGLYFITVRTHGRQRLFGEVDAGEMRRSAFGDVAHEQWLRTLERPEVVPDVFVVMPDHVHLLFGLVPPPEASGDRDTEIDRRGTARCAPTGTASAPGTMRGLGHMVSGTVPVIVRAYKSAVTRAINTAREASGETVWQRGYHDRLVRSRREAGHIRRYIAENPARWDPHH